MEVQCEKSRKVVLSILACAVRPRLRNRTAWSKKQYEQLTTFTKLKPAEPSAVKLSDGSSWRHASVIGSCKDAELESILGFLMSGTNASATARSEE